MIKLSFTTLGCPNWDMETICANGRAYGFDGVDFRGYRNTLDITRSPEFTTGIKDSKRRLADAGLDVSGISSSITLCSPDKLAENLDEARRTIELAQGLRCKQVRVFGGGDLNASNRDELAKIGADCAVRILELDGAQDIRWLLETHDHWVSGQDCRLILDAIPDSAFGVLWDMGHTCRIGTESPGNFWEIVQGRVGYTHIKDAVFDPLHPQAMSDGWRYVLPGSGQLALAECIQVLQLSGYRGWLLFEHEKRWHPDLPEPEEAFPAFVQWARPLL